MAKYEAKSIFICHEREVWATLQRHQSMLCRSNEQLEMKNAKAVDLASLCLELKDEATDVRGKLAPLEEKVRLLRAKMAPLEEEVWLLMGNL